MKTLPTLILFSAAALVSCEKEMKTPSATAVEQEAGYQSPAPAWEEADYTGWMSRAELQYLQEMSPSERYFAYVEGRNNRGVSQFRAVQLDFQTDQYSQWAVFWGIDEKELFDWELRLLKTGFQRQSMQLFFDSNGTAIHQIVWLRPVGAIDNVPDGEVGMVAAEPVLPEPSGEGEGQAASVLVPLEEAPAETIAPVEPPAEEPAAPIARKVYIVVPGDNLGRIASKHKTTVSALKTRNGLTSDVLRIGQTLTIP